MAGLTIRVRGIVQGVGFRPTVWRLAQEYSISGTVLNDADGLLISAWGKESDLTGFNAALEVSPPPLARIEDVEVCPLHDDPPFGDFRIIESASGETRTGVSPDAATCPECLSDTLNANNRRHRYPFTNCTHCGPRLSILRSVPYDRAQTSMRDFKMCGACQAEYDDPASRRFHAQPNACSKCGPRVWLEDTEGNEIKPGSEIDVVATAAKLIKKGHIIAIKGIGGFHLACDATQEKVVSRLRVRKRRFGKPFALMARDVENIRAYAKVNEDEARLLGTPAAPIVLLETEGETLASSIAPGHAKLGFMLPYTPLHHLLLDGVGAPLVMTSGNISDEPQCFDNDAARKSLNQIADFFLVNDRDIVNRLDDSVLRFMDGSPRFLRRARGYTPEPLVLPDGFEDARDILAMGAELKNTFCLLKNGRAIVSQHMGDLEEMAVLQDYLGSHALYEKLFDHSPQAIAIDRHPGYLSSQTGLQWGQERGLPVIETQHHHAHITSCMAEHGLSADTEDVLGIVLDGLGMGTDDTIWGGEFLQVGYAEFQRLARFQPIPMIGGTQAIREPWRSAYAHIRQYMDWHLASEKYENLDLFEELQRRPLNNLNAMAVKGLNSPLASSCGRLFDAAAAILGICRDGITFEGEAAILMENMAAPYFRSEKDQAYLSSVKDADGNLMEIKWGELWLSLLDDLKSGTDKALVAARFHQGVVVAVSGLAERLARQQGLNTVVLSGGVFQNCLILEGISEALTKMNLRVLSPRLFPANDGGLSLGQAVIAAAKIRT